MKILKHLSSLSYVFYRPFRTPWFGYRYLVNSTNFKTHHSIIFSNLLLSIRYCYGGDHLRSPQAPLCFHSGPSKSPVLDARARTCCLRLHPCRVENLLLFPRPYFRIFPSAPSVLKHLQSVFFLQVGYQFSHQYKWKMKLKCIIIIITQRETLGVR
jgi:hypothetical protein